MDIGSSTDTDSVERRQTLLTPDSLASYIQHTLIEPGVTRDDIVAHCKEGVQYGFNAVMIPGCWVGLARDVLSGSGVAVGSAVDFPLGIMSTVGKVAEAEALVRAGAEQLDIGVQIGWLRSGLLDAFRADIAAVVAAVSPTPIKVMLELPLLTPVQRDAAVRLSVEAGVAYVKNASSGAIGVATPEQMRYLRSHTPRNVGVKASGGIKTFEQAVALLENGADILGTSAGLAIIGAGSATAGSY